MIATPQPGTCQTCLYWESDAEQAGRCLPITLYKGAPASGGDATEAAYLEAYRMLTQLFLQEDWEQLAAIAAEGMSAAVWQISQAAVPVPAKF
ncbi:hypothetical protein PN498_13395 [Oscillatoria sp. CS-180]|uniref:hypothetical protein n=1 Tax=Oscillatoria sp. CS-180 TaxID=3021720 RepID=UPI00232C44F9|nr:hypothetical protein [Oscillatoria sp. CS-180]MDB9526989.1 hypothetical protein [Oscillatoria sp. CS-180]